MNIKKHYLVRFTRRTGKIDKTMVGLGNAIMRLWALQNTTKTKDTIIFNDDGWVVWYFEGTEDFPKVTEYNTKETGFIHIDTFCEGLLEAVREESGLE